MAYLLVRNTDVPCHYAAHRSHVSRWSGRVPQISLGVALFRERLAAMPVQYAIIVLSRFAQLVHLSQQIPLLLFQHRHLHLRWRRRQKGNVMAFGYRLMLVLLFSVSVIRGTICMVYSQGFDKFWILENLGTWEFGGLSVLSLVNS